MKTNFVSSFLEKRYGVKPASLGKPVFAWNSPEAKAEIKRVAEHMDRELDRIGEEFTKQAFSSTGFKYDYTVTFENWIPADQLDDGKCECGSQSNLRSEGHSTWCKLWTKS